MEYYTYQNRLIGKKELRQLLAWSFTNYDSMQACALADELKYLGFKYASQAGISISIEDLRIPFVKTVILSTANQEIRNTEKIYLKGKITNVERFQKIIDTWNLTSESLKDQIIYFFKRYDPLNSVYIMAFSGARGNLSQVRQLVGMRGLMSDPSGQIMNLPIKKNFREGLTITDYLMSGYGARKGIVDTALKTANSGYLTRRLIDVAQDILIREKNCLTTHSVLFSIIDLNLNEIKKNLIGRILSKAIFEPQTHKLIAKKDTQITIELINQLKSNQIKRVYTKSPLTCSLYRAICQQCYGWDLANESLIDIGEAIGIVAGQSIGEPGTQLTMRTFHTGGIFTSEARQQIISPFNGTIQYYKALKTVILRTNGGDDVLITKNSGSLILIPDIISTNLIEIEVTRNTILFPKNNQYITKDTVIGERINTNKQTKIEIKPILSDRCGEIFIPKLKQRINLQNNNKLIWILSGQLYNSPLNSFINFHSDYKLNQQSYIFRTKFVTVYNARVTFINNKSSLHERRVKLQNQKYQLKNTTLKKIKIPISIYSYVLQIEKRKYFLNLCQKHKKNYVLFSRNRTIGELISNEFQTLVGGIVYYDFQNIIHNTNLISNQRYYYSRGNKNKSYKSILRYNTVVWLNEEFHEVNCEPSLLLVENGDFICKEFELIPGLFSKTSGFIQIIQKNNFIKTIIIKPGLVYEGKKFKKKANKLYYPGERIFLNVRTNSLSFCEYIRLKNNEQFVIRPIEIYEFANPTQKSFLNTQKLSKNDSFNLNSKSIYLYKPNQNLNGVNNINLILTILNFKTIHFFDKNINLQVCKNSKFASIDFQMVENIDIRNFIQPSLRYQNLHSCFLIQQNQFISRYTVLGYLETLTLNPMEIVKCKIKKQKNKQIFLISNDDCVTVKRTEIEDKQINDFVISKLNLAKIGKIIIKTKNYVTLQKGRPYFFPNCNNEKINFKTNLLYKLISSSRVLSNFKTDRDISLNYFNIVKLLVRRPLLLQHNISNAKERFRSEFSKLFIKNNQKLYSCLVPQFFNKFSIKDKLTSLKTQNLICLPSSTNLASKKISRTVILKNSNLIQNINKDNLVNQLTLLKFVEQPLKKVTKAVGLYAITEDYFEQEINNVFCKNNEFIDAGKTIGLLNLEKEITGDIVQGLPRIEEMLEARKKNTFLKQIPTSQKKGLLTQRASLDISFEFKSLGTTLQENDKINPHKLLKVYFNYYGALKQFSCDQTKKLNYARLVNNYEGSYRSFKKIQLFILNAVQSVYQSQGITISDKHLEIVIKQMTTKVLITYEGETPLLRREVIDLYHIHYINHIIYTKKKQMACYIPLLLGITKAALNNPSFVSAASFQETTRIITQAAIEGRIDWLRGLKENIILGHLIPAGTGSQNYRYTFRQRLVKENF